MNILIPSGIFPPDIGGPANFVPRIAQWLALRGHVVNVVCWSDELVGDDGQYAFRVYRIARRGSRFSRLLKTVMQLYRLGRSADVIFANSLDLEARIAASLLRKPELHKVVGDRAWEIARVSGWYADTIDDYQIGKKPFRLRLLDLLRNFSLARASLIVAPSHYLANIVAGWNAGPCATQVIYNSTELDATFQPIDLPAYNGKTISTVCRLVPWKGVDSLIGVLARLPDCRLVIAGSGPDKKKLQNLAEQLGLADRVLFLDQVEKRQVRALLEASDLFVLNSGYEGLPHVVLEAMAARVPVIATDVGGTGEVVRHNETGMLISFGNDQQLFDRINQLLSSPELSLKLTVNARKMIEQKFEEEACFLAYENALSGLVAPSLLAKSSVRKACAK